MMKSKHIDFKRLNDTMDTALRDAEIRAFWEGLSYSELSYDTKVEKVKKRYHLSYESVTRVIYNK